MEATPAFNYGSTITKKKILCVGEILWDLLPEGAKAGGAPMNVAIHLKKFGLEVSFAGRIGDDPPGNNLKKYLEQQGLDTELLQVDEKFPTSTVVVHLESDGNNVRFEIVDNVAWDRIILTEELEDAANKADVIIYGTLASRHSITRRTILDILKSSSCLKLLDINLRAPFYNKEVVEELIETASIIKLNNDEIKIISGWYGKNYDEKNLAQWLAEKYHCEIICVTRGAAGASIYGNGQFFEHPGFKVDVKDTVGSGDAFLAGFIAKYLSGESLDISLEYGCATGALIATMAGATPTYSQGEILKIIESPNRGNLNDLIENLQTRKL
ncbi:MAG: carbohydrate kinase [Bacteroidales bacterium]|nr:carbohydrate kinase [Bacteroidales bacterium]